MHTHLLRSFIAITRCIVPAPVIHLLVHLAPHGRRELQSVALQNLHHILCIPSLLHPHMGNGDYLNGSQKWNLIHWHLSNTHKQITPTQILPTHNTLHI